MGQKARTFSREFKLEAVARMQAGEPASGLAKALGSRRKLLYDWKQRIGQRGLVSFTGKVGRPAKTSAERQKDQEQTVAQHTAALERLVGRQQLAIDFLERALQQIKASPGRSNAIGETRFSPLSARKPQK